MAWTCIKFNSYSLSTSLSIQLKHRNKAFLLFIFQVSVTFPNKLEGVKRYRGTCKEKSRRNSGQELGGKMAVKITKKIINFETLLKVSKRPPADKAVCIKQECLF